MIPKDLYKVYTGLKYAETTYNRIKYGKKKASWKSCQTPIEYGRRFKKYGNFNRRGEETARNIKRYVFLVKMGILVLYT